jgi:hypothetical protein
VCGHAGASPRTLAAAQEGSDGGGSESTAQPGGRAQGAGRRAIWNAGSAGTLDFGWNAGWNQKRPIAALTIMHLSSRYGCCS